MNEKQAWLFLRDAYYTPFDKATKEQNSIVRFETDTCGICESLYHLCIFNYIDINTLNRMWDDIEFEIEYADPFCLALFNRQGEMARGDYCGLMVEVCSGDLVD